MALPVRLKDIAGDLQLVSDTSYAYLNRRTGETRILTDDELRHADDFGHNIEVMNWEREALRMSQEVVASEDWLELPSRWEIDDYRIMQTFCQSTVRDDHRAQLLQAISGRGAFRYFRDTVERLGLLEAWYAYRDRACEDIAAEWLEAHDIPFLSEAGEQAS